MSPLAYRRNVATIERMANEILTQCAHFRRNESRGEDDSIRIAYLVDSQVEALRRVTQQARRRWDRQHPL